MEKLFVKPLDLYKDSIKLGNQILKSKYKPDGIIGVVRGGAVPCLVIQELLKLNGLDIPFDIITAKSYDGDKQTSEIKLYGLSEVKASGKRLLLVDDLWDTGNTMCKVSAALKSMGAAEIKTGVIYYKPTKNLQNVKPDYYLKETSSWVVFPHELEDSIKHPLHSCLKIRETS